MPVGAFMNRWGTSASPEHSSDLPSTPGSVSNFIKRHSGLSEPLYFYRDANGTPQVTLRFDQAAHKYFLVRDDGSLEMQDGVTSVCHKGIDKSLHLMPWAAKMCVEQLLRTVPTKQRADGTMVLAEIPLADFTVIANEAKAAHRNRVEDASDIGHLAHNCLEETIKYAIAHTGGIVEALVNKPADERAGNCCEAALKWMRAHKVRWIETERKIYSRTHKVAGTLDGLCYVSSCDDYLCCGNYGRPAFTDRLSVADWKSSNALHVEYLYQTAIYEFAIIEELGLPVEDRWVLRLGKEDGEFEPWHLTADCYEADLAGFLRCLDLVRANRVVEDRMSAMRKVKTAANRARKADEKRLAKDAERVRKALAREEKKRERAAEKQRLKDEKAKARTEKKQQREAEKLRQKEQRAAQPKRTRRKDDPQHRANVSRALEQIAVEAQDQAEADKPVVHSLLWQRDGLVYTLLMLSDETCRIAPKGDAWEITAQLAGKRYRGERATVEEAVKAANTLVESKSTLQPCKVVELKVTELIASLSQLADAVGRTAGGDTEAYGGSDFGNS